MTKVFNPPPAWPEPPHDGWAPPDGWRPELQWGPVPAGWRTWVPAEQVHPVPAPLLESEEVPASGARPRPRVEDYPVTVLNPGMWSQNHLEAEDYGFGPEPPRTERPRLRLAVTIAVTVLGFLLAAATAVLFVRLADYAVTELPDRAAPSVLIAPAPGTDPAAAAA